LERAVPARLTPTEGRKFAFPVGIAFGVLAGIVTWRGHSTPAVVFASLSGLLLLAGLIMPGKLGPVYRAWMGFALAISKVTTPIFMGVVYFLVIAPVGLVMRVLGRNPVAHESIKGSYFVVRETGAARRSNLTRQF
jgi:hypothetical protein